MTWILVSRSHQNLSNGINKKICHGRCTSVVSSGNLAAWGFEPENLMDPSCFLNHQATTGGPRNLPKTFVWALCMISLMLLQVWMMKVGQVVIIIIIIISGLWLLHLTTCICQSQGYPTRYKSPLKKPTFKEHALKPLKIPSFIIFVFNVQPA